MVNWPVLGMLLCTVCAVIAATVCIGIWFAIGRRIDVGDANVKASTRVEIERMRLSSVAMVRSMQSVRQSLSRIETQRESETDNYLRPRDLGVMHDKINAVAQELATIGARTSTETRMLSEQLRVVQRLVEARIETRSDR